MRRLSIMLNCTANNLYRYANAVQSSAFHSWELDIKRNRHLLSNLTHNFCIPTAERRWYTSTNAAAAEQSECWNCKKATPKRALMICEDCGYLQDVNTNINYFALLQFPTNFVLEPQLLTQRFRQLQTLVHPDKFSKKTSREQSNSADWSSLINKAYKTLATPIERGQYILHLQGEDLPKDNSALNQNFLLAMMERNEEVEDANTTFELNQLQEEIIEELKSKIRSLAEHFATQDLAAAKTMLVEMKYLLSIENSIKAKLQRILDR